MTAAVAPRRALTELRINNVSQPLLDVSLASALQLSRKRPFWTIKDHETQAPAKSPRPHLPKTSSEVPESPVGGTATVAETKNIEQCEQAAAVRGDASASEEDSVSSNNDFDMDDSITSQQTDATELTTSTRAQASQHAETLRLRLRLAQFKLRTNQVNVPFSYLRSAPTLDKDLPLDAEPMAASIRQSPSGLVSGPRDSLPWDGTNVDFVQESGTRDTEARARTAAATEDASSGDNSAILPRNPFSSGPMKEQSTPEVRRKAYGHDESLSSSAIKGKAALSLLNLSTRCA